MQRIDQARVQQKQDRNEQLNRNKETLTLLSDLTALGTYADERWVRISSDLDVSQYTVVFAMNTLLFVVLLLFGSVAFLLGSVPTGVLYLPLSIVNMLVMCTFIAVMGACSPQNVASWDTAALILFVLSLLTLIGQSTVFLMTWMEMIELHVDPAIDPRVWLLRYFTTISGCAAMPIAIFMTIVTFFARPDDTDVVYLNLTP